jgi:tetratricopeptide (TPR) repeat protein
VNPREMTAMKTKSQPMRRLKKTNDLYRLVFPLVKMRAVIPYLILTVLLLSTLTACDTFDKNASPQELKEKYFDPQPTNFDEAMEFGNHCLSQNNRVKAIERFKQAMKFAEDMYGPDDPRIANAAEAAASLDVDDKKFGEAEELYRKAYDILSKTAPADSVELQHLKKSYAEILLQNFKLDEAKKVYPQIQVPGASRHSSDKVSHAH